MSARPVDLHPSGVWRAAGLPRVALRPLQRVCEASGDPVPGAVSSPRSGRRRPGTSWWPTFVLEASPFHGEGYRKVWVKLRVEGRRHLEGAGAAVDAGARPPGPAARGARARAEGAPRDHHH